MVSGPWHRPDHPGHLIHWRALFGHPGCGNNGRISIPYRRRNVYCTRASFRQGGRLALEILLSIVYLAAGLVLLANPLTGAFTLTLFLIGFFIAQGGLKIIHAVRFRGVSNWGWMLFSGILSLVLAFFLLVGLPLTAFWAIGVIIGIDFIFSGVSIVMISLSMREAVREGKTFCIGNVCFAQ